MNMTIYFKKEEPHANLKHLGMVLFLLFVFANSMGFGQSADSVSVGTTKPEVVSSAATGQYLTVISVVVAILAALTTIAISIPAITAFIHIRRADKDWERFTKKGSKKGTPSTLVNWLNS